DVEYAEDGQYQLKLPTGEDCICKKKKKATNVSGRPSQNRPSIQHSGTLRYTSTLSVYRPEMLPKLKSLSTRINAVHTSQAFIISVVGEVNRIPSAFREPVYTTTSTSTTTAIVTAIRTALNLPRPTSTSTVTVYDVTRVECPFPAAPS